MNKRHALFLTAVLGMATAQAQTAPIPVTSATTVVNTGGDPQLSKANVTFNISQTGNALTATLIALAKSAGYEIVIEPSAAAALVGTATPTQAAGGQLATYNFVNRPFNEVWPLLLDLYGLSYENIQVGNTGILRVSVKPIQRIMALPESLDAVRVERQLKLSFGTLKRVEATNTQGVNNDSSSTSNTVSSTKTIQEDIILDSSTLKIVAETVSNSIIVRGTNQEVAQVVSLLNGIISQANTGAYIRQVYSLKGNWSTIESVLSGQFPDIRVTPAGRQVILTGVASRIEAANALLNQIDQAPTITGPQTVQRVFQLTNASAEEVKATLEGTLARDLTTDSSGDALPNVPVTATDANGNTTVVSVPNALGRTANQGTAQTQATQTQATQTQAAPAGTQQATLIADKRTNSLIVRGTPEQVAQVAELIPQLDQVVPQINVQVRIQEVNERALQSLGLNWRATFGGFNVAVTGGTGLAATFNPTQSFLGFNIFPTLTALETQGLTRRVYDGNVTMQSGQRSLSATGGAQNASSSAAASVKSGGRLEINIPSAAGNIVRQIDYGLNLDFFSPQVAPDGTITLRVRGQVNQPATPITADSLPNLIDFTNSEAQSTITFRNGQTVLMSGLLGSTETNSSSGVPFLSSLPGIGAAFGEKRSEKTQSQLLVIITGTVVK
ncbi:secretin [Deinococcus wulumuqiensis]|uniref:Secretin n=1 Tax=Deinococcus wulumuqiensis TaxID=980427 RepID=A0A345IH51_9DEIO|nr:secretin [Deinococcus wulumuqiensis]